MNDNFKNKTILLFDGYCNLCNSSVKFILKHEKKTDLYFTSLQSEIGIQILKHYSLNPNEINSLVLIENNKAFIKSSGALRVLKYLKGLYPLGFGMIIVPKFIRNIIYDFISKNRYKWYGKMDSCLIPDKELAKRFL